MKTKLFFVCMFLLICISTAHTQPYEESDILVIILAPPSIILGDDEYGDDTIDDDGTVWATLTTDQNVTSCEINWEGSWQNIDKTIASANYFYSSNGSKTVYYRCYDGNYNSITVDDSILVGECYTDDDCNYLDDDYCDGDLIKHDEGKCVSYECTTETTTVEDCDNSLFCDGQETCNAAACVAGTAPEIDDGVSCTVDSCDEENDVVVNAPTDSLCDNGLWCDGGEYCDAINDCQAGTAVDCSANDLAGIATCTNDPDKNPFTWDYFAGFTSTCNEATDSCTTGTVSLTHTCSAAQCSAECDATHACEDNSCSETYGDYCDGKKLVEYDNDKVLDSTTVEDSCSNDCLADCTCTDCSVDCSAPAINKYCVKDVCSAECAIDDDCAATDCDLLDGCIGNDYYDYDDIANNCLEECSCETNLCGLPTIYTNDPRCVEFEDPDRDGIPSDVDNCIFVYNPAQIDTDLDGVGDACEDNIDGDSIPDETDFVEGNESFIDTNIEEINIIIDSDDNLDQEIIGEKYVEFIDNIKKETLVEFNFSFGEVIEGKVQKLDFSKITIKKQNESADSGSILIRGIDLTLQGKTKTVYLDNINPNKNSVCVKDAEVASIEEISVGCDGEDETLISCPGSNGPYTCLIKGDKYKITGVVHSGAKEVYSCVTDDDCNDLDKDYCDGDSVKHDEGKCINNECTTETATVEDCNDLDEDYCSGTEIKHSDYTCSNAACVLDETTTVQDCDDKLYCDGKESCKDAACVAGTAVDCSGNNLAGIATCDNDPDKNPFTWDYFAGFTSTCNEVTDSCTTGTVSLTHTCSVDDCDAECEEDSDCDANSCSETYNDYCDGKKLVEYDSDKIKDSTTVTDSCENNCKDDCSCEDCGVDCSAPSTNSYCVKDVCDAECAADADCSCAGVDGCIDSDGDGLIDDYADYPAGSCQNGCTCGSCEATISKGDARCKTTMNVVIDKGVSMFSLPLEPVSQVTFNAIQSGCKFTPGYPNGISYMNPSTGAYTYINGDAVLYPGQGYFTTQQNRCELTIEGYRFTMDYAGYLGSHAIKTGWNMIGAPSEQVDDFDNVEGNCNVVSGPWGFDSATYKDVRTQTLVPGKGYWIKTTNSCKLG